MRFTIAFAVFVAQAFTSAWAAPAANTEPGEPEVYVRNDFSDLFTRNVIGHLYTRGPYFSKPEPLFGTPPPPPVPHNSPVTRPATPQTPPSPQRPSTPLGQPLLSAGDRDAQQKGWAWNGPKPPELQEIIDKHLAKPGPQQRQ
ncbi:hypothetical protein EIP91_006130 [Steccherinum ochraceum]|uniref:Uncharacterized protein n=1 Tax=Steccherinum ochraceum TaxID=92696 RepID=A0A4V2MXE6_9APHY|nr:hypothetical protein EIP91_006130 [Steccherinum ochraceum]